MRLDTKANLLIVVALEEVGDLRLTDLWVSMVISRCRSAHLKVEELGMALLGATQRVKQLLESAVGIESLHFCFNIN